MSGENRRRGGGGKRRKDRVEKKTGEGEERNERRG